MARKTIAVVLEEEDIHFLKEIAEENDTSVSQVTRWLMAMTRGTSFSPSVRFAERFIKQISSQEAAA